MPCNIRNSTFYGNNSHQGGSAVSGHQDLTSDPTGVHVDNVTFAHNGEQWGTTTLDGSKYVLNNTVFHSSGARICSSTDNTGHDVRQFMSGALTEDAPCIPGVPATVQSDPFPAMGDNGGPTLTAMPASGSGGELLSGAGSDCEAKDQRGVSRDVAHCTLGAVEVTSP